MAQVQPLSGLEEDPLWYKDAIIYELHVRAFQDSNSDGMGDFRGMAQRLDYLEQLGVTAIWLLPFFPSPWKDDGYDISDFRSVHSAYGNLRDFQLFLKEAHRRGLRVITELVINHTSDQHEWFQKSRRAEKGSKWRDFYVWSDTPDKYLGTRIIFKDFEPSNWSWDPVAKAYFWHRFYSHQPDLNFDNPVVRRTVARMLDFWAEMGVDGFRLDAIPYLYEREGTSCENLPETHAFLKELRRHLDSHHPGRMLLSEANMWPEDAVAYMGNGDECHMNFHFPLMPRLFMALRLEDRLPVVEILNRTPVIPETCQWAMFLRNHDELTLEMVTDEERDYMYRVYASDQRARINLGIRRRLAPLLQNDRARIEVMNALLFSMPGTPVVYYGDEIGMGDNVFLGDRNGVRTPMQWSPDRNAGFSRANPQQLYLPVNIDPAYHYEAINVETQQDNPYSLLNWTKRLISLRKQYKAFGRGTFEFLHPANRCVLAYLRRYQDEAILVVANLSRFAQPFELNLEKYNGYAPVELFGRNEFPVIGDGHYPLTLGPNSFYWFSLEPKSVAAVATTQPAERTPAEPPLVYAHGLDVWDPINLPALASVLPAFLVRQRWFRSKDRRFRSVDIAEVIRVVPDKFAILLVRADYTSGDPETYVVPAGLLGAEAVSESPIEQRELVFARMRRGDGATFVLYDAIVNAEFTTALMDAFARRRKFNGEDGVLHALRNREFRTLWGGTHPDLTPTVLPSEVHSSIKFGDRFVFKLLRQVEPGIYPGVEMGHFLTEQRHFPYAVPFAGSLEFQPPTGQSTVMGLLHGYFPNEGDAWHLTNLALMDFLHSVRVSKYGRGDLMKSAPTAIYSLDFALSETPAIAQQLIGSYLQQVRDMGGRVAELHLELIRDVADPAFAPEPFNDFYRQMLFHSNLALTSRRLEFLRQRYTDMGDEPRRLANKVITLENDITNHFRRLFDQRVPSIRIRFHSRLHLGHLLMREGQAVMFDFEGDPHLHISERRIKRCPLRDVTSMLYSFGYAASAATRQFYSAEGHESMDWESARVWGRFWYSHVTPAFLQGYWAKAGNAPYMPNSRHHQQILLDNYLLERALLDLRRDISERPELALFPLRVILHLLNAEESPAEE
jgi:maltose alpha-D-glucosyltransferase/alpha-amylase